MYGPPTSIIESSTVNSNFQDNYPISIPNPDDLWTLRNQCTQINTLVFTLVRSTQLLCSVKDLLPQGRITLELYCKVLTNTGRVHQASPTLGITQGQNLDGRRSESAFQDEADFSLFVAATSGISPEDSRRNSSTSSLGWHEEPEQLPVEEETPRTLVALSQFAQLPQSAPITPRPSLTDPLLRGHQQGDFFSHPYSSDVHDDDHDDELPDYAQSQAEMLSQARREAIRRADSLKRKWKQGRGE
ncbi:hypothetical protein MBLNU459_g3584t1 [Dothideomycetes sp. NU459]